MLKCKKGFLIQPLRSAAGWYMGTLDKEGYPNCRIFSGYAKNKEEALDLPLDRGYAIEIQYCNRGEGCLSV